MKTSNGKANSLIRLYLLIWLIEILGLQIPQQLLELFLVLISHEYPLQGHGAPLRPDAVTCLWARPRPHQGPWESLAAAFPIASAIPLSISTSSPSSTSILSTCTATAASFARSGGRAKKTEENERDEGKGGICQEISTPR